MRRESTLPLCLSVLLLALGRELAVSTVVLLSRSLEVELDSAAKHSAIQRLIRSRQAT